MVVPRGPSTVTIRERMWILTSSGMTSCSWEKMYFILSSGVWCAIEESSKVGAV
jgi:hypothetical protein